MTAILYLYVMPAMEVLVPLALGVAVLWRSRTRRSFSYWAIGMSLTVGSGITLVLMVVFYASMISASGMERIGLLIAPAIPLIVIPLVSIIFYCCLVLWVYFLSAPVADRGPGKTPGVRQAKLSGGILLAAAFAAFVWLLPYIHMFPYTSLHYESNSRAFEFGAWNPFTEKSQHILTLYNEDWPTIDPRFELQLDWRGRVVLNVRDLRNPAEGEMIKVYYLPFEPATYELREGVPYKVKDTVTEVDWRE